MSSPRGITIDPSTLYGSKIKNSWAYWILEPIAAIVNEVDWVKEWVNLAYSPGKILPWYPNAIAKILLKGVKLSVTAFSRQPDIIITPYTQDQLICLAACDDDWAITMTIVTAKFDNHCRGQLCI